MPLYLVRVKLRRSVLTEVVREIPDRDLERVYQKLFYLCQKKYDSKLESFDCVMISKRSPKALQYKAHLGKKEIDLSDIPKLLPTRNRKERPAINTTLGDRSKNSPAV